MAEYVNKENLIRHIDNRFGEISTPFVLREIKNFPNADVVEVVRCKDCKWWHTDGCAFRKDAVKDLPAAGDFCSHGERKE